MTAARQLGPYLSALMGSEPTVGSRPTGLLPGTFDALLSRLPAIARRLAVDAGSNSDVLEMAIAEAEPLSPNKLDDIWVVATRASREDTSTVLTDFVATWAPQHEATDLSVYSYHLAGDVEANRPSYFALADAVRRLRRKCRALPSISEFIDEIDEREGLITEALKALDDLPALLQNARAALATRRGSPRDQIVPGFPAPLPKPRPSTLRR